MPWERLPALLEPYYPKGGNSEGGRPPVVLAWGERMRIKTSVLVLPIVSSSDLP